MITAYFDPKQSKRLLTRLNLLPAKISRKILREESRKSAKDILLPEAKRVVPKQTGALKKSIKVRALKRSQLRTGVRIGYSAKDFTGDTFYGSFLEYGWRVGKRSAAQLRAQSFFSKRKKRDEETGGLSSKSGRKRSSKIEDINAAALKTGDNRRHVPGKYYLKSIANSHGDEAASVFLKRTSERVDKELRSWQI